MSESTEKSPENPFEGWMTFKEAGEIVNRNHSTIRYWAETGKITSHPVGSHGLRLVHIDEVRDYSDNHSYRLEPSKRGRLKKSK
jgi:DNA-binding transcriptional MerR regulator